MPRMLTVLRAGIAALPVAGFAGLAEAQSPGTHLLTIRLPDGGIAQIRYAGKLAPRVYFSDAPAPVFIAWPTMFGLGSPFAEMERISAAMDRQAARLFQLAGALSSQSPQLNPKAIAALPAGTREYQFVSTITGAGVCGRSVEITSRGNGVAPRVETQSSGNC